MFPSMVLYGKVNVTTFSMLPYLAEELCCSKTDNLYLSVIYIIYVNLNLQYIIIHIIHNYIIYNIIRTSETNQIGRQTIRFMISIKEYQYIIIHIILY